MHTTGLHADQHMTSPASAGQYGRNHKWGSAAYHATLKGSALEGTQVLQPQKGNCFWGELQD